MALVDDHQMFRTGVRTALGASVEVVGEAGSVAEAVELVRRTHPDVVLLDVHMPDGGGLAVIAALGGHTPGAASAASIPGTRFLALSVSDAAEDVIAVVRAGARGYVTKTVSAEDLVDAVRRVAEGDAVFSPRLAGFVLDAFAAPDVGVVDAELDRLTTREREAMRLIARGFTYREIADELVVSVKTVESHVSATLRKLQLSNRRELARWATDRRIG